MPTVHELRNEIRLAVDRFEREIAADFTKEDLAAICTALGEPVGDGRLPPKGEMRRDILAAVGERAAGGERVERSFRKGELEVIHDAVATA